MSDMRNPEISTGRYVTYLRKTAKEEAAEGEFSPEEHMLWYAADRLEDLVNFALNDDIPNRLRAIADIMETKQEAQDAK